MPSPDRAIGSLRLDHHRRPDHRQHTSRPGSPFVSSTNTRRNSSASGFTLHKIDRPRFSVRISPACLSSFRWCETVDMLWLKRQQTSPTDMGPAGRQLPSSSMTISRSQHRRNSKIRRRVGSPRALNTDASASSFDISTIIEIYHTTPPLALTPPRPRSPRHRVTLPGVTG